MISSVAPRGGARGKGSHRMRPRYPGSDRATAGPRKRNLIRSRRRLGTFRSLTPHDPPIGSALAAGAGGFASWRDTRAVLVHCSRAMDRSTDRIGGEQWIEHSEGVSRLLASDGSINGPTGGEQRIEHSEGVSRSLASDGSINGRPMASNGSSTRRGAVDCSRLMDRSMAD